METCPSCGQIMFDSAGFCKRCGAVTMPSPHSKSFSWRDYY
ncbi:MAG: hypothetical protein Q7K43_00430 [Candidatus Woesearchaeota archaeon]|nr:hypothetical protein [Candidatus Woesearchaeota archaeon]